eukprot:GHVQ01012586.1.p1 GENE.GHVQ01012586.1~~GHVQ01012586.1.p1  ORF type:complete len:471 (+),score=30.88 GHVQ01012586.1:84-1496(+)
MGIVVRLSFVGHYVTAFLRPHLLHPIEVSIIDMCRSWSSNASGLMCSSLCCVDETGPTYSHSFPDPSELLGALISPTATFSKKHSGTASANRKAVPSVRQFRPPADILSSLLSGSPTNHNPTAVSQLTQSATGCSNHASGGTESGTSVDSNSWYVPRTSASSRMGPDEVLRVDTAASTTMGNGGTREAPQQIPASLSCPSLGPVRPLVSYPSTESVVRYRDGLKETVLMHPELAWGLEEEKREETVMKCAATLAGKKFLNNPLTSMTFYDPLTMQDPLVSAGKDRFWKMHWYPRHMNKAVNEMRNAVKLADVIIEVRDARFPASTNHPIIDAVSQNKPRIVVLTRTDLASELGVKDWRRFLRISNRLSHRERLESVPEGQPTPWEIPVVFANAKRGDRGIILLKKALFKVGKIVSARRARRGLFPRSTRAIVIGYPNVGKSAVINRLLGRAKARSYNSPGVTRKIQVDRN